MPGFGRMKAGLALAICALMLAGCGPLSCTDGLTLRIGMSTQDALHAGCSPAHVNTTQTARGTLEQWVYSDGYVFFDNDRLTTIQRFR
jgi:hypothetical protein